jgi:hypothetical protein
MPILPFQDPLIQSNDPPGVGEGGGGFSPPQCPITTTRTVCEPATTTSCSCINSGPKNPVAPSSWRLTEVGDSGTGGYDYIGGWRSSTTTSYDPTTQTATLNGAPSSWNPPYPYGYTGYMRLILNCSDGSSHVLDSWTTINGHPTSNPGGSHPIISSTMNPCGTQGPIEDVSGRDEAGCNNARTAFPDYNISWNCVTSTEESCSEVTDTTYVEAVMAGMFGGLFGAAKPTLSNAERIKYLSEMLKNFKGYDLSDKVAGYKEIYTNGKLTALKPIFTAKPDNMSDLAWRTYKTLTNKAVDELNKEVLNYTSGGKPSELLKKILSNTDESKAVLKKIGKGATIAGILAILIFGSDEPLDAAIIDILTDPNSVGDGEIRWECPDVGGNNTGDTTGGVGNPDGSIGLPNGKQVSPSYNGSPSRSKFFYNNNSSININSLNNSSTTSSSFMSNNNQLNQNYGFPSTSFPVLKVPKQESGIITSPGFPTPPEGMPISGPGFPTPEPIYYPFTRN